MLRPGLTSTSTEREDLGGPGRTWEDLEDLGGPGGPGRTWRTWWTHCHTRCLLPVSGPGSWGERWREMERDGERWRVMSVIRKKLLEREQSLLPCYTQTHTVTHTCTNKQTHTPTTNIGAVLWFESGQQFVYLHLYQVLNTSFTDWDVPDQMEDLRTFMIYDLW